MSVLTYNGVTLPFSYHTHFSQDPVMDDLGQVDKCYTKFDLKCEGVLNTSYASTIDGSGAAPAAELMDRIRGKLMEPRKTLQVTFDSFDLIPRTGALDARNGPIPQSCEIMLLTNTTFLISYHIIAHYVEHSDGSTGGNKVLSNRWEERVEIDSDNFTRRIRDGRFLIRSDGSQKEADELREDMAILGVPNGFLRESAHYTISPDGLALKFRITDVEKYRMPPQPAFRAEGTYTETATRFGAWRIGEVWIKLHGQKTTDQAELMNKAMAICATKLNINGALSAPGKAGFLLGIFNFNRMGRLEQLTATADQYNNTVEVRARAVMKPDGKGRLKGASSIRPSRICGNPSGSGPSTPHPSYRDRGTAGVLLQAAAYWDPSIDGLNLNAFTGQISAGTAIGKGGAG